ncbi:MAG: type III secretion system export apparatus subunit SctU [Deltaproteobacteria bacterium]|nr:type III secretion system export apparatus subunit SctU [Deltaproteobacteria bacterium]
MSDDKTEQPTPKRLRDAREKGDVCKSQDIASALSVMAVGIYCIAMSKTLLLTLSDMMRVPMRFMSLPFSEALPMIVAAEFKGGLLIVGPLVIMVMGVALLANLGQVGVVFAFKAAMPKAENLNPAKWFQKVFSVRNAVELIKNIVKVLVLAQVVRLVITDHFRTLFSIRYGDIEGMWSVLGNTLQDLVLKAGGAFCVIAAVDYVFQRWQYGKQHMMSKEEVKQEYKEMEGDPHIKGKRKQLHQELIAQNNMENVRRAKVLITNPTHYAIALDYDKEKIPLPFILAKGEGILAERMIAVAKEEGIPIMQNVPLAHSLFEYGTENSFIPKDLIGPVAEVLRWVQSLSN